MKSIDKLIELAKSEVGYLEKSSAYDLDSKYGNAGTANYTKYARDIDAIPDLLNGKKQGYAWCTIFFLWLLAQAFGAENVRRLCYLPEKSLAAGCKFAVEYYKAAGAFGKTPTVGAQIFFADGSGVPSHTGIVTGFDSTYVYTIEGNTSDAAGVVANGGCVAAKSYKLSYSRIHGYGYPDYAAMEKEDENAMKEALKNLEKLVDALTLRVDKLTEAVGKTAKTVEQNLTEEQQLQARTNIGAASFAYVERAVEGLKKELRGVGTQPSTWAQDELLAAMEAGITDGTRPRGYATREEVALMVLRSTKVGQEPDDKPDDEMSIPPDVATVMANDSY